MAKSRVIAQQLILRGAVTTSDTTYQQGEIDVGAFVNINEGECLRLKRVFWDFSNNSDFHAITAAAIGTTESLGLTCCLTASSHTSSQSATEGDVLAKCYFYMCTDGTPEIIMIEKMPELDPGNYANGFIVATDKLFVSVDANVTLVAEIQVACIMEFETIKISREDALSAAAALLQ